MPWGVAGVVAEAITYESQQSLCILNVNQDFVGLMRQLCYYSSASLESWPQQLHKSHMRIKNELSLSGVKETVLFFFSRASLELWPQY